MKKTILFVLFLFFLNPVHAQLMTDLPDYVLFNFQIEESGEGVLALPYDSTLGSDYQISAADASAIGANESAWLDGPANGGNGGLGVCKSNDCSSNPADASLNINEALELTYTGVDPIFIGDIFFLNGDHGKTFAGDTEFGLSIDGGAIMFALLMHQVSAFRDLEVLSGQTVEFFFGDPSTGGSKGEDYFVAGWGVVPIPAALPLFLSGLFGFAFFSRRKKAATA